MAQIAATRTCNTTRPSWTSFLKRAVFVRRQRRHLARLDARALEDIGITRTEAMIEARRPFWDAPETWRK